MTAPLDMTDTATAIAVVGSDTFGAALTALEIARRAATSRRVAIIDLTGDALPLIDKVSEADPYGVSDCFTYGMSFTATMHATDDPNISIIPSGTEPLNYETILTSSRWEHFVRQSRDNDTLLIFVVPPLAAELGDLLAHVDRVVAGELGSRPPFALHPSSSTPARQPERKIRWNRLVAASLLVAVIGGALAYAWVEEQGAAITHLTLAPTAVEGTSASAADTVTSLANAQIDTSSAGNTAAATPVAARPSSTVSPAVDSGYDIQFVATQDAGLAHTVADGLAKSGFLAHVNTFGPKYQPTYRVLLGPYATRVAADSAGRLTHQSYWVRSHIPE